MSDLITGGYNVSPVCHMILTVIDKLMCNPHNSLMYALSQINRYSNTKQVRNCIV